MVQSLDELIETITPAFAKNGNMREAVTLCQGLSITPGHLANEFGFEDLIVPRSPQSIGDMFTARPTVLLTTARRLFSIFIYSAHNTLSDFI
jgi:hypothetical protein